MKRQRVETVWDRGPLGLQQVCLEVRRALPCEWVNFQEHHYKDHSLHCNAKGWVGMLGGQPVACTFVVDWVPNAVGLGRRGLSSKGEDLGIVEPEWLALPLEWASRPLVREHRTVVLPDFQGCSLGSAMSDAVAREHELQGYLFCSKTAHPHFGSYRDRSPFWRPSPGNGQVDKFGKRFFNHFWVGAARPDGTRDPVRQKELDARARNLRAALWSAA